MKNLCAALFTAMTLAVAPAVAAPLGLDLNPGAVIQSGDVLPLEYLEFGGATDLLIFASDAAALINGSPAVTELFFDLNVGFVGGDMANPSGALFIEDTSGTLFAGDVTAIGMGAGTIELLFENISGDLAGIIPNRAVGIITVLDAMGANPFDMLQDGMLVNVSFSLFAVAADPIPLPAAAPLMLAGLGGIGFARFRKRKALLA